MGQFYKKEDRKESLLTSVTEANSIHNKLKKKSKKRGQEEESETRAQWLQGGLGGKRGAKVQFVQKYESDVRKVPPTQKISKCQL